VIPVVWGAILAVVAQPAYLRLRVALGGREVLAAVVLVALSIALLAVPTALLAGTLLEFSRELGTGVAQGAIDIPPPPQAVRGWPLVGERLYANWELASDNLEAALREFEPQLRASLGWLLSAAAGTGVAMLQFAISLVIAAALLARAQRAPETARRVGRRLGGERGAELVDLAGETVRSVARGVVGVALIQSFLAGLGFLVVGVPGAGLWALLCVVVAVIQLPIALVLIPIAIYVFTVASTPAAVAFLVWSVLVSLIDNVLKPLLLGRGVQVPMLVIFVGTIGGFLAYGIIGLFVGSLVLAVGYVLIRGWIAEAPGEAGGFDAPSP
jgi:predicted PurR-regulated permease PerM